MTDSANANFPPGAFKGIALFTPGGDVVYCIDAQKQSHWHLDLCTALQEYLSLPEPPFFLLPCYTATVDRWIDPASQRPITLAEAYPKVIRYQALLNAVFNLEGVIWQPNYTAGETCSPQLLDTHREQFPCLWQTQDLVLQVTSSSLKTATAKTSKGTPNSHIYRLFVSSEETASTERILEALRQTMEQVLQHPYTLQVVDVRQHPDKAEADLISVTPTLVRTWPQPLRRLAGGLGDRDRLVQFLYSEEG